MPKIEATDMQSQNSLLTEEYFNLKAPLIKNRRETSTLIQKGSWIWFLRGAMGLGKSLLGVDTVSAEVRRLRMATCIKCRHLAGNPLRATFQVKCSICGCIAWHKANNADEECPEGKWH